MNIFLIDKQKLIKETKKNLFNIIISFIIIFFSSTIYLSLPSFYNYENFDKEIQKKIAKDFKLNIKNIKGIQYSFLPQPHFIIEQSSLYFLNNDKNELANLKNLKVYVFLKNLHDINKIELKKETGSIVLESTDNVRWRMLQPLQLRADGAEVKDILSQFEFLRKVGTIKESETANFSLGNYGLDKPQIVVNLWIKESAILKGTEGTTGAASKYTINVGGRLAAGQNTVYINIEGSNDVVVVAAIFLEKIDKNMLQIVYLLLLLFLK